MLHHRIFPTMPAELVRKTTCGAAQLNALRVIAEQREACWKCISSDGAWPRAVHGAHDMCELVHENVLSAHGAMADTMREILEQQTGIAALNQSIESGHCELLDAIIGAAQCRGQQRHQRVEGDT